MDFFYIKKTRTELRGKNLILPLLFLILFDVTNTNIQAQWRFTATVTTSGPCSSSAIDNNGNLNHDRLTTALSISVAKAACDNYSSQIYTSKRECDLVWSSSDLQSFEVNGCKIIITKTKCSGPASSESGVNIAGPGQGSAFYSVNAADEIANWYKDDLGRQIALNPNFSMFNPGSSVTGDNKYDEARRNIREEGWTLDPNRTFVSVNLREGGFSRMSSDDFRSFSMRPLQSNQDKVNQYLSRVDITTMPISWGVESLMEWIKARFKDVSGYDIDVIERRFSPTAEEREILANYRDFMNALTEKAIKALQNNLAEIDNSPEKRRIDDAILARACYGDDMSYLEETNFVRLTLDKLDPNDPMWRVVKAIEQANTTQSVTGFHAEIYYNELTGQHTIGFAGSDDLKDWLYNNPKQAMGKEFNQQKLAGMIADAINALPPDAKINIVGHSLGGALASYVALATGRPASTYNAEGVSDEILAANGLLDKKNNHEYDITAYHTSTDLLSNLQDATPGNTIAASAIGDRVNLGDLNSTSELVASVAVGSIVAAVSAVPVVLPLLAAAAVACTEYGQDAAVAFLPAEVAPLAPVAAAAAAEVASQNPAATGMAAATVLYMGLAHQSGKFVEYNKNTYGSTQNAWTGHNNSVTSMRNEQEKARRRSLSYINVTTSD